MTEQSKRTFLDKCVKNKQGKLTVFQTPNAPIIVGLTSLILARLTEPGKFNTFLELLSFGALFTWAWLEIFSGVNYLRRAFGAVILIVLLTNRIY